MNCRIVLLAASVASENGDAAVVEPEGELLCFLLMYVRDVNKQWTSNSCWFICNRHIASERLNNTALCVHTSELRDVTCRMGSHSVTCHLTQVNAPHLTPARTPALLDLPTIERRKAELTYVALHTGMVYLPAVTYPSINQAWCRVINWLQPTRYCQVKPPQSSVCVNGKIQQYFFGGTFRRCSYIMMCSMYVCNY